MTVKSTSLRGSENLCLTKCGQEREVDVATTMLDRVRRAHLPNTSILVNRVRPGELGGRTNHSGQVCSVIGRGSTDGVVAIEPLKR